MKKKSTLTQIAFFLGGMFFLQTGMIHAQNWGTYSEVSDNWPNNDVKSHDGNLYVASNDGLFKSTDNGLTWNNLTAGANVGADFVEIQFTNDDYIFLRQNSNGVVSSLDGGSTWLVDTAGVGQNYGTDMLYYDVISDRIFLGVTFPIKQLFYKTPTDASWTAVTSANLPAGFANFSPVQMTREGDKLFIIDLYKRVMESSDNGSNWIQKAGTGIPDAASQVGPGRLLSIGTDLYFGMVGVWKSSDDGDTWTSIDVGFDLTAGLYVDTRCLFYDGSTLYASTQANRKTYKSTDLGVTWSAFGGSGEWWFKALAEHNGALFGVIHSKDSLYVLGGSASVKEDQQLAEISIYPNPSTDHVMLSGVLPGSIVSLMDLNGKVIVTESSNQSPHKMYLPNVSEGTYLLEIRNSEGVERKKLLVNN